MIRLIKQKQTEASFYVARFMMMKHSNLVLRKTQSAVAWLMQRRYGKDALDFLEEEDSLDENF